MQDFDLGESIEKKNESLTRHEVGQSIKLSINRQNDIKAREEKGDFVLTRPKIEVLSEPCESCSA